MRINPVLWLEQALEEDPGEPCPPLAGIARADVCMVGGGFAGWVGTIGDAIHHGAGFSGNGVAPSAPW